MKCASLDLAVPFLAGCRDCGKAAVIWATADEDEIPRPLDGVCGRPDRCGDRQHGLTCETRTDVLIELLHEVPE